MSNNGSNGDDAIKKKKQNRGDVTDSETTSDGVEKPDFKGFFNQFIVSDVIGYILITIVLFGPIGVYMSHVAHSNVLPGLSCIPSAAPNSEESLMNVIREWEWSFSPKHTWAQKAKFMYDESTAFFKLLKVDKDNSSVKIGGIQQYNYNILKYLGEVDNLCINYIFGALYHLPEWMTMLVFLPVWFISMLFLLLVSWIFHFVGMFSNIYGLFGYNDKGDNVDGNDGWGVIIGRVCYLIVHFWVMSCILPWVSTFAALIAPLRTTFKWDQSDGKGATGVKSFKEFFKAALPSKQTFIFILISLSMISNANSYLGGGFAGGAVFSIAIFVYLGWFKSGIDKIPASMRSTFFLLDPKES